jgi:hypothetical protein
MIVIFEAGLQHVIASWFQTSAVHRNITLLRSTGCLSRSARQLTSDA